MLQNSNNPFIKNDEFALRRLQHANAAYLRIVLDRAQEQQDGTLLNPEDDRTMLSRIDEHGLEIITFNTDSTLGVKLEEQKVREQDDYNIFLNNKVVLIFLMNMAALALASNPYIY